MVTINNNITILSSNTISNSQNTNSSSKTIAELSIADIKSLSTAQISGLTSAQIAELSTAQISGFGTGQIAALSTSQITALSTSQLAALDDNQVDALSAGQISALTLGQTTVFLKHETSGSGSDTGISAPIGQKIARQGYFPDSQIELLSYLSQTPLTVAASTAPQPALVQGLVASDIQGLNRQSLTGLAPDGTTAPKPFVTDRAVAFVDSQIAGNDGLIKDLQAKGITTFVIDQGSDGLTQMANDVRGMSDISSIHIFSHANSGMLSIGSGTVDQTTPMPANYSKSARAFRARVIFCSTAAMWRPLRLAVISWLHWPKPPAQILPPRSTRQDPNYSAATGFLKARSARSTASHWSLIIFRVCCCLPPASPQAGRRQTLPGFPTAKSPLCRQTS